jgi:hypothetical protein
MLIQFSVSKTLPFGFVIKLRFFFVIQQAVSSFAVIFFGVAGVGVGVMAVDCGTAAFPFFSGQS